MEEKRLVERKVYAEVPPRVEYTLTEMGYSLKPILDAMWAWGEEYQAKINRLCNQAACISASGYFNAVSESYKSLIANKGFRDYP